jgi:hypothetical protein
MSITGVQEALSVLDYGTKINEYSKRNSYYNTIES